MTPISPQSPKILVVEDNSTNRQLTTGILRMLGYTRVDAVTNGAEAVETLANSAYDLVLMDVQMPVMDGLEATRRIRCALTGVKNREIPVIAMSALALHGDREKCLLAGMDDYLTKPVMPEQLRAAVARWADKKHQAAAAGSTEAPSVPHAGTKSLDPVIFNKAALLKKSMEDWEFARAVIGEFLREMPVLLGTLQRHLANHETMEATIVAHGIRGASENVGAEELCEIATAAEEAGRTGNLEVLLARLPDLAAGFTRFRLTVIDSKPANRLEFDCKRQSTSPGPEFAAKQCDSIPTAGSRP